MMRSMSSAVSALRNHQTRMDVVGNNIANVNTVGYKTSRVVFKDALNQMVRGAAGASETRGGMNPHQIGMGMGVSSIDTIFGQGVADNTNKLSDVMIEGEGFFMVSADGNADGRLYTRAGNFDIDGKGNLVNADGLRVLGYQADKDGKSIGTNLGTISIPLADTFPPKVTSEMNMQGNLDGRTKIKTYTNVYGDPSKKIDVQATDTLFIAKYVKEGDPTKGIIYSVNSKFADQVARETDVYVYDSLGERHNIKLVYAKTDKGQYALHAFALGKNGAMYPANDQGAADTTAAAAAGPNEGIATLKFGEDGKHIISEPPKTDDSKTKVALTLSPQNGAGKVNFTIDMSELTQYSVDSSAVMAKQNGYTVGALKNFEISPDGTVNGIFSNGQAKTFGKIATAVFSNPSGLVKLGGSLFRDSANSGEPQINAPGVAANGLLKPGYLEMSGVDLGVEFTNMITTQRGFQANSRTISTTDQMLEELVNLKR